MPNFHVLCPSLGWFYLISIRSIPPPVSNAVWMVGPWRCRLHDQSPALLGTAQIQELRAGAITMRKAADPPPDRRKRYVWHIWHGAWITAHNQARIGDNWRTLNFDELWSINFHQVKLWTLGAQPQTLIQQKFRRAVHGLATGLLQKVGTDGIKWEFEYVLKGKQWGNDANIFREFWGIPSSDKS